MHNYASVPSNLGIHPKHFRKQERAVRRGLRYRVYDVRLNLVENFDSIVDDEVVDHEVDNRRVDVDAVRCGRGDVIRRAEEGEGNVWGVIADAWAGLCNGSACQTWVKRLFKRKYARLW